LEIIINNKIKLISMEITREFQKFLEGICAPSAVEQAGNTKELKSSLIQIKNLIRKFEELNPDLEESE